jgi:hypothetical protein
VTFNGIAAGSPAARVSSPAPGDFAAVEFAVDMSGDATQETINEAGVEAAYDFSTMAPAFVAAETLWRNSRCVFVAIPEWEAMSPLEVRSQGSIDHSENVEPDSETPFVVDVQHRFGQSVVTPRLEAKLGGDESLEPETIEKPPGRLTYTAPSDEGGKGTVRMTSTSRQGIGILAVDFEVGVQGYEVTLVRKTSGAPWDPTTLTITGVLKPDPADPAVFQTEAGRASGTLLTYDFDGGACKQEAHRGTVLIVGQIIDGNLTILSLLTDPFVIESGALEGVTPEGGGTTRQEREPELAPGEDPPVGATCYAYSTITQTTTVKPLAPGP